MKMTNDDDAEEEEEEEKKVSKRRLTMTSTELADWKRAANW
jgi:hypothetical protein